MGAQLELGALTRAPQWGPGLVQAQVVPAESFEPGVAEQEAEPLVQAPMVERAHWVNRVAQRRVTSQLGE